MPSPPPPFQSRASPAQRLAAQAAAAHGAGRYVEAVGLMRQAVGLAPGVAMLWHDLGLSCGESGLVGEAEAAFRRAAELLPSLSGAQYRLAEILEASGRRTEAIERFTRAAKTAPKGPMKLMAEARALQLSERDAEAERAYRRVLQHFPNNAFALGRLATICSESGRFDEARPLFELQLAQSPRSVAAYYELARLARTAPQDRALLDRMKAAAEQPGLSNEDLSRLKLAIGKVCDDLGDCRAAMAAYDEAWELRRRDLQFDLKAFLARAERLVARFTPDLMARAPTLGVSDPTPVLIVGMPRSGTTLCEQIISSHPEAHGAGELPFWENRGAKLEQAGAAGLAADGLRAAGADFVAVLRGFHATAARITDKAPWNFAWAGLIHLALPEARIIHCRRSPIDTALSIHQTHFNARAPFPTGGEELVAYYRAYERLMAHWRAVLPADRFIEVDYEALTSDPEPQIRRIIEFIGLPWDEACLRPQDNRRAVRTPSKWQTRQPINTGSVDKWRRYEPYLGPLAVLAPH